MLVTIAMCPHQWDAASGQSFQKKVKLYMFILNIVYVMSVIHLWVEIHRLNPLSVCQLGIIKYEILIIRV